MKTPWPFQHFGLKILSLGLAIMLWVVIAGEETVERGLRVPLEFQQFPAGLELQTEAPSLVDVRVRGASGTLSRMGPGDIVAVLDLRSARPGQRLYQLTPEQVRVPFGVQVVQVTPPTVALVFEQSASKLVPVTPAIEGNPAPGFVIGKPSTQPATVEVIGPQSAVERVTEALTEPVLVAGATQNVIESVTVGFENPSLRLKNPRAAVVTVPVLPGPVERALPDRPVHMRNLATNLTAQVSPTAVHVIVRGSRQGLSRVDREAVSAFVDLAGLGPGEYVLGVRVDAPQEAGVARIVPETVEVRISNEAFLKPSGKGGVR
jgi:YbbR domain-containing protein